MNRLHSEVQNVMRSVQMKDRYVAFAIEPVERTPQQFGEYVKSELVKWGKIIQVSGARIR